MENNPNEAATPAPAEATVATPTNTNNGPAPEASQPAVDMHGFSQEDLAGMRRFIDNNGGWDAIKAKISTPKSAQPAEPAQTVQPVNEPTSQTQAQPEPAFKTPAGAITAQEFLAQQYFQALSKEEKYAPISKGIENGEYLKEMSAFGINPMNQDGSINDQKVRMYLDLKAQTVPAQPTGSEPNASNAPTVEYYQVDGDKITTIDQAYKIIQQDAQLMASGQGHHPLTSQAEEFIKAKYNKTSSEKK